MSADLEQLQADFPRVDVATEYSRARAKYGDVNLGWFRLNWLPRAAPVRPRRASREDQEAALRRQVWAIATAKDAPAGWQRWFADTFPAVDAIAWQGAPLDVRQRFARALLAREGQYPHPPP